MAVRNRVLVVAAAAVVASIAPTVPAHADVRRFTDPRHDTSSTVDILAVRVDNSTTHRNKVIVTVRQANVRFGDSITIYVDTRAKDPGPEYAIAGTTASEYLMRHQERWSGYGKPIPFQCGYRLRIHQRTDATRAVIPRHCLGDPGRVRVAVKAVRGQPPTSRDWAEARRSWLPWVRR